MTVASALVAASAILLAAALAELGKVRRSSGPSRRRVLGGRARWIELGAPSPAIGSASRIARAGVGSSLSPAGLALLRCSGAVAGGLIGAAAVTIFPGRLGLVALLLALGAGALAPDLALERKARRRRHQVAVALPDALEVLAVGMGVGRSVGSGVSELARAGTGVLSRELGATAAEIECGRSPREAIESLRERAPGPELRIVTSTIERSARLGSPLVEELHRIAESMRDTRRRRMGEKASRAAPKIQLVIAMVLVPSVLLMIAAGLVANAGDLFAGL